MTTIALEEFVWTDVTVHYRHHKLVGKPTPDIDVALIVKARPTPAAGNPATLAVSVACPRCGAIHHHGVIAGEDPGTRVSHCHSGSYRLAWAAPELADTLLEEHETCCAITAAGTRCTRPTRTRRWLCAQHADQIGDDLKIRFHYPIEAVG